MSGKQGQSPEAMVKEIRRVTRRKFTRRKRSGSFWRGQRGSEHRRVMPAEGLSAICIIAEQGLFGSRQEAFAGGHGSGGDSTEVVGLRQENEQLKQLVVSYL